MSDSIDDGFERYFAEKLWEMIPGIYRHEDGLAEHPGVLRALVEILAEQTAIVRRSHDRLWDDQFIELCDSWAVSYLADLVGTRLVSALNKRARRVDVAKTIYYRRRKGTPRVLEELISDITEWEGTVVENYRRLGRIRHRLDPPPLLFAGQHSGTLPGGWADLRRQRVTELAGGPFSEFHHTADMRQHRGVDGRYGIPKLAFHLYRLRAFRVERATPHARDARSFSIDPSGRDIPLFMPRSRDEHYDYDTWRAAWEWELPAPMRCRVLGHAEYTITENLVQTLGLAAPAAEDLRTLRGIRFPNEHHLRMTLDILPSRAILTAPAIYQALLEGALIEQCGKHALLPNALAVEATPGNVVSRASSVAGDLVNWAANAPNKELVGDPERGRLLFPHNAPAGPVTVTYYYGFSGEVGAGTYSRPAVEDRVPSVQHRGGGNLASADIDNNGITQIDDSATYGQIGNKLGVLDLTLQAANHHRPYIRLEKANWILNTGTNENAELLLDGLWLGCYANYAVILRGDYEQVTIRNCTFDPGGYDWDENPICPMPLVVEGEVERMVVEASIMGPIRVASGGIVEMLEVRDTIIQSDGVPALALMDGELHMERVTVFGPVDVHRLWASEVLLTDTAHVIDTQNGCFRFSAAPTGSRLPRPYEYHFFEDTNHYFTSRRFGHPGYAQLSQTAPVELLRGAEDGSEIGAFSSLLNPIKLDGLRAKVDEYIPFGLIPLFIQET